MLKNEKYILDLCSQAISFKVQADGILWQEKVCEPFGIACICIYIFEKNKSFKHPQCRLEKVYEPLG